MAVEQANIKLAVAGLTGLIGMATGVSIPATMQALDLFNAIRDTKRRRAARDLATAAAVEIEALRSREYAREPASGIFASALATAADTLACHRLSSSDFLALQLQPERAADAVLAHARFNRLDGDAIPATARRLLACFYAKLREEKDLLEAVLPDVYGEIMRQGETLDRLDARTERIERQTQAALRWLKEESDRKDATIAALEAAVRALARDAEAAPEEPALERALALLAQGKTGEAEAHFRDVAERKAESGRLKLRAGTNDLEEAAEAERHLGALASLRSVEDALAAYRRAAALDPDDIWTWIFISRLELAAGWLPPAADAAQRAITASLATGNRYDEGSAHEALGDVQITQGKLSDALTSFNARHAIISRFVAADPGNAEWQRGLSVSWDRIGDVRRAQGELAGALDAYTKSHAIANKLAAADPGNATWQRSLSVSWEKIGNVLRAQGDLAGALDAYTEAKAIAEKLAATDPGNAVWQRDLIVSRVKLSEVATGTAEARAHLTAALEIARALQAAGRLAPVDAWIPAKLDDRKRWGGRPSTALMWQSGGVERPQQRRRPWEKSA